MAQPKGSARTLQKPATYIVEHLDPELGPWSELEYAAIAKESHETGNAFLLSSLPPSLKVPAALASLPALKCETTGVEELYADSKHRVCLLDPAAAEDLSPDDGERFDVFLFGGILGSSLSSLWCWAVSGRGPRWRVLDPRTNGNLGDDPPRGMFSALCALDQMALLPVHSLTCIDRTSELRKKGFQGRRLGPKQMTTDTAVRVTRIVVQDKGNVFPRSCIPPTPGDPAQPSWHSLVHGTTHLTTCSPPGPGPLRRLSRTQVQQQREHRDALPLRQGKRREAHHARGESTWCLPCRAYPP